MSAFGSYLVLVLISFAIVRCAVAVGTKSGRKWFQGIPVEKERERYRQERPNNLTLAGFALAALTLFLTIGTNPLEPTRQLDVLETTFFLSISLVSFIIAAHLFPIAISRYFSYVADSLEQLGMLAIGIGLLTFFVNNFNEALDIQQVYWIFFGVITALGGLEIYFYTRLFNSLKQASASST